MIILMKIIQNIKLINQQFSYTNRGAVTVFFSVVNKRWKRLKHRRNTSGASIYFLSVRLVSVLLDCTTCFPLLLGCTSCTSPYLLNVRPVFSPYFLRLRLVSPLTSWVYVLCLPLLLEFMSCLFLLIEWTSCVSPYFLSHVSCVSSYFLSVRLVSSPTSWVYVLCLPLNLECTSCVSP